MPALEDKLKKLKEDVAKNVSDGAEVSRLEGALKKAQDGTINYFLDNFVDNWLFSQLWKKQAVRLKKWSHR